jgi:pyrroline-5-carboxylate reductase
MSELFIYRKEVVRIEPVYAIYINGGDLDKALPLRQRRVSLSCLFTKKRVMSPKGQLENLVNAGKAFQKIAESLADAANQLSKIGPGIAAEIAQNLHNSATETDLAEDQKRNRGEEKK